MPEFQVEMVWQCSACKTIVKGRFGSRSAGGCGKAKEGEPFFDDPGEGTVGLEGAITDPTTANIYHVHCQFTKRSSATATADNAPSMPAVPRSSASLRRIYSTTSALGIATKAPTSGG